VALDDIDHIVVLMLENHSFDSILGKLSPAPSGFDGLKGTERNLNAAGDIFPVWNAGGLDNESMSVPTPDPGESFKDINTQLFGTSAPALGAVADMSGFVRNYMQQTDSPPAQYDPKAVMHYFIPEQVPVISTLANAFAVCDRWHASAPCQTWPNRFFAHTGTANGYVNNSPPHFPYEMPTIFGKLEAKGLNWKVYFHDIPQALTLSELWFKLDHFHFFEAFQQDAKDGTLPAYSFIEPRYFADTALPNDQHPPHNATMAEQLIAAVYDAVRAGKNWASTLLIITYDEHGGCYDHVPPPPAVPPVAVPPDLTGAPFKFDRYGVRVPAVLVSPYIARGSLLRPPGNVPFDHTSIIATLRERFDLGAPLTSRDAVAPHVGAALSLPTPSNGGPNTLSALPYITSPPVLAQAGTMTLNGHQQGLLQLAAHLPATTSTGDPGAFIGSFVAHLKAGAAGTNVSGIQTVADAATFIKSRLGNLFRSL